MKQYKFLSIFIVAAILIPLAPSPAHALSCLPVDMYLKDLIGKDEIVIFVGKAMNQIEEKDYTAEVIMVEEVKQGYAEEEVMVYHEKHPNWGYLCNTGPGKKGEMGLYVTIRDSFGKYNVTQRLALTDSLIKTLDADLKKAEIEGQIAETTSTDRMNQIMTTITDTLKQIQILLKEYVYWKNN